MFVICQTSFFVWSFRVESMFRPFLYLFSFFLLLSFPPSYFFFLTWFQCVCLFICGWCHRVCFLCSKSTTRYRTNRLSLFSSLCCRVYTRGAGAWCVCVCETADAVLIGTIHTHTHAFTHTHTESKRNWRTSKASSIGSRQRFQLRRCQYYSTKARFLLQSRRRLTCPISITEIEVCVCVLEEPTNWTEAPSLAWKTEIINSHTGTPIGKGNEMGIDRLSECW